MQADKGCTASNFTALYGEKWKNLNKNTFLLKIIAGFHSSWTIYIVRLEKDLFFKCSTKLPEASVGLSFGGKKIITFKGFL